jgi:hypothetical protein
MRVFILLWSFDIGITSVYKFVRTMENLPL